jgi:arylsulfatase A
MRWRPIVRSSLFCLGLLFCGALPTPLCAADSPTKPNIIFILADDYGPPGVGCYGGDFKTPHIDALAARGLRFDYCFSAPLCGPSRAMLMTGRYAFRTGVLDNSTGPVITPQKEFSVAKVLKQAGYATAVAGKWRQLSHFTTREDGQAWGFDEFMIWGVSFDQDHGERYWEPRYNQNGQFLADVKDKYGPDLLHDFVVDFIRRHRDKPFFLYYPMPLIHRPTLRTPDSAPDMKDETTLYADNISYMDKLVGKLMAELDNLKLRQKTLVVFVGDNGNVEKGTIRGRTVDGVKGSLREGGSRVPLIASWPGTTPSGKVCKDLIDFTDFFPTLAELAGGKLPTGVTLDGRTFAAQLKGQAAKPRDWVYVQLYGERYVRDPRWKLTHEGQFFDMQDAPFREIPVPVETADAQTQAARHRLQAVLNNLLAQDEHKNDPSAAKKARK